MNVIKWAWRWLRHDPMLIIVLAAMLGTVVMTIGFARGGAFAHRPPAAYYWHDPGTNVCWASLDHYRPNARVVACTGDVKQKAQKVGK